MEIIVKHWDNREAGSLEVSEAVFGTHFREGLVHQVVNAAFANKRTGTHATKGRKEVSGGGKKPWQQKGSGRARAGTNRSPLWRGGGIIFGPKPRDYRQKVNKKMRRGAMCSLLSELLRREELIVVAHLGVDRGKTRELAATLKALGAEEALLIVPERDEGVTRAGRNLPRVEVVSVGQVGPLDLVTHDRVVITESALQSLEERLS